MAKDLVAVKILDLPGGGGSCSCGGVLFFGLNRPKIYH